ncbi:MAG: response regulator, partial [Chloroflexi bacterium]|nr:response regulator [Chloroflexota bacterium]
MATVLVADDEKNILQLARMYLQAEGFTVETAANGREALEKVKVAKPDLLVLDLMMPEIDGWEVCRRLRKESDLPIIMLTARGDDVDKIVGLELGADDYMTKPFNARELVARVNEAHVPAMKALVSAQSLAAESLGLGDRIG